MTELVQWLLDVIQTEWNTANYDPMPIRFHRDDSKRLDTAARTQDVDLTEGNIVGVSSAPTTEFQGLAGQHSVKARPGLSVRVEGVHTDQRGHVAGADDWAALVGEVKRTIWTRRRHPLPSDGYFRLHIRDEDNRSAGNREYYRTDLTVEFQGYTSLP